MDLPSPTTLAAILSFSPGLDGKASPLSEAEEENPIQRLMDVMDTMGAEASTEERLAYGEEFASQYLPSFLRTLVDRKRAGNKVLYSAFFAWLVCSAVPPSFHRYLREQPREAAATYFAMVEVLQGISMMMDDSAEIFQAVNVVCGIICGFTSYFVSLTDLCSIPPLPPPLAAGLHSVTTRFKSDPRFKAASLFGPGDFDSICGVLDFAARGTMSTSAKREAEVHTGHPMIWWSCELRRWSKIEGLTCVEPGEEAKMMACCRCLAVRYCSKEHQKADWKRHKLACFKPSW